MTLALFFPIIVFHVVFLSIVIYNFITAPKIFNSQKASDNAEKISVLIPVRNEEKNIRKLLDTITNQGYKNYEVIVLDDGSTDNSYQITESYKGENENISLIRGSELPSDWLGKNWACYQLSKLANGEFLLFIDADVILKRNALAYSYWLIRKYDLAMLSVFPTQKTNSFGERLVVPVMNWLLLTFLPLLQVYKSSNKSFSAANGQYILIRKDAYEAIGTHKKFRTNVVEDMEIIRSVKENKMKAMTCIGNNTIFASMYDSFRDSINGFSKNFYAGFNINRFNFLLLISFLLLLFFLPIVFTVWNRMYLIIVGFIIFERTLVSILSRENFFYNILLHPFQILIMFIVGLGSLSKKKKVWKGRIISQKNTF